MLPAFTEIYIHARPSHHSTFLLPFLRITVLVVYCPLVPSLKCLSISNPKAQRGTFSEAPQSRQVHPDRSDGVPHKPCLHILPVLRVRLLLTQRIRIAAAINHSADRCSNQRHKGEVRSRKDGAVGVPPSDVGCFERLMGGQPPSGEQTADSRAQSEKRNHDIPLLEHRRPVPAQILAGERLPTGISEEGGELGVLVERQSDRGGACAQG